ncbi:MAG: GNAT family N-acetyltransferase [bacterium]|nr:GNAT family N-acetyltransferase [bacterium]
MNVEDDAVVIWYGLRDDERLRAAEIYYEAFGGQQCIVLGSSKTAIPTLAKEFTGTAVFLAQYRGETVGLIGMKFLKEDYICIRPLTLVRTFGWIAGLIRFFLWRLMDQRTPKRGLLLDSIAVDGRFRSLGIGRRLIIAVFDLARNRGLTEVALQVVDTNPRAQNLYERLGFTADRTYRVPFMRSIMGFSAYTVMTKPVR